MMDLPGAMDQAARTGCRMVLLAGNTGPKYCLLGAGSAPEESDDDSGGSCCGVVTEEVVLYNQTLVKALESEHGVPNGSAVSKVKMQEELHQSMVECAPENYAERYSPIAGKLHEMVTAWLDSLSAGELLQVTNSLLLMQRKSTRNLLTELEDELKSKDSTSCLDHARHSRADRGPGGDDNGEGYVLATDETLLGMLNVEAGVLVEWQAEFDLLVGHNQADPTNESKLVALGSLVSDFTRAATMYARVIISEHGLPRPAKSIRPAAGLGGMAGGDKFVAGGIFFKFSIDKLGLYGSNYKASKSARHDLRYLSLLFAHKPADLSIPLTCLVTYKGLSVLAQALLPGIDGINTLVYGSGDGGKSVKNCSARGRQMMEQIGENLNLLPHACSGETMALCGDIELHHTKNDKYFVLDTARLMPPEPVNTRASIVRAKANYQTDHALADVLTRHLRSELVTKFDTPLCADAFTMFDSDEEDRTRHKKEIAACYDQLVKKVIPSFVTILEESSPDETNLSHRMHVAGINVRHLNRVYECMDRDDWRAVCMAEMAARTHKELFSGIYSVISQRLEGSVAVERPYVRAFIRFVNELSMPQSPVGTKLWKQGLLVMRDKFRSGNAENMVNFKDKMHFGVFLRRLLSMSGMECRMSSLTSLFSQPMLDTQVHSHGVLHDGNIDGVRPSIHAMSVVDLTMGIKSFRQAVLTTSRTLRLQHLNDSMRALQSSFESATGISKLYLPQVYLHLLLTLRSLDLVENFKSRGLFYVSHAMEVIDNFVIAWTLDAHHGHDRVELRRASRSSRGLSQRSVGTDSSGGAVETIFGKSAREAVPQRMWGEICNLLFRVYCILHERDNSMKIPPQSVLGDRFSRLRVRELLKHSPAPSESLGAVLTGTLEEYSCCRLVAEFIDLENEAWHIESNVNHVARGAHRMVMIVSEVAVHDSMVAGAIAARTALLLSSVAPISIVQGEAESGHAFSGLRLLCRRLADVATDSASSIGAETLLDHMYTQCIGPVGDWCDALPMLLLPLCVMAVDDEGARFGATMMKRAAGRMDFSVSGMTGLMSAIQYCIMREDFVEARSLAHIAVTSPPPSGEEDFANESWQRRAFNVIASFISLCDGSLSPSLVLDLLEEKIDGGQHCPCDMGWAALVPRVCRLHAEGRVWGVCDSEAEEVLSRVEKLVPDEGGLWRWELEVELSIVLCHRGIAALNEVAQASSIQAPTVEAALVTVMNLLERGETGSAGAEASGSIIAASKLHCLTAHALGLLLVILAFVMKNMKGAPSSGECERIVEILDESAKAAGIDTFEVTMSPASHMDKVTELAGMVNSAKEDHLRRVDILMAKCGVNEFSDPDYDRIAGLCVQFADQTIESLGVISGDEEYASTHAPKAAAMRSLRSIIGANPQGMVLPEFFSVAQAMLEELGTRFHEQNLVHGSLSPAAFSIYSHPDGVHAATLRKAPLEVIAGGADIPDILSYRYTAPELITRERIYHEADLYLIGLCFYEMLTGSYPFGDIFKSSELSLAHRNRNPDPIGSRRSNVPDALVNIVQMLLNKAPISRYRSAVAVSRALEAAKIGNPFKELGPISSPQFTAIFQKRNFRRARGSYTEFVSFGSPTLVLLTGPSGSGKSFIVDGMLDNSQISVNDDDMISSLLQDGNEDVNIIRIDGRFGDSSVHGSDLSRALVRAISMMAAPKRERIRHEASDIIAALCPEILEDRNGLLEGMGIAASTPPEGDALRSRNMFLIVQLLRVICIVGSGRVVLRMDAVDLADSCSIDALATVGKMSDVDLLVVLSGINAPSDHMLAKLKESFEDGSYQHLELDSLDLEETTAAFDAIFVSDDSVGTNGGFEELAGAVLDMKGGLCADLLRTAKWLYNHRRICFSFTTGRFEYEDAIQYLRENSTGNPKVIRAKVNAARSQHAAVERVLAILLETNLEMSKDEIATVVRVYHPNVGNGPYSPAGVSEAISLLCESGILIEKNENFMFAHSLVARESAAAVSGTGMDCNPIYLITGLLNVCAKVYDVQPTAWGKGSLPPLDMSCIERFGEVIVKAACHEDTRHLLSDPIRLRDISELVISGCSQSLQRQQPGKAYFLIRMVMITLYRLHSPGGQDLSLPEEGPVDDIASKGYDIADANAKLEAAAWVRQLESASALWEGVDSSILLDLCVSLALAMFSNGMRSMCEGFFMMLLQKFNRKRETTRVFHLYVEQLSFRWSFKEVMEFTADAVASLFDVAMPADPTQEMAEEMMKLVLSRIRSLPSVDDISQLPICDDPDVELLTNVLAGGIVAGVTENQKFFVYCMCQGLLTMFDRGITPSVVMPLAALSASQHEFTKSLELVRPLSMVTVSVMDDPRLSIPPRIRLQAMHFLGKTGHLARSDPNISVNMYNDAYRLALSIGNFTFASRTGMGYMNELLIVSRNVGKVREWTLHYRNTMKSIGDLFFADIALMTASSMSRLEQQHVEDLEELVEKAGKALPLAGLFPLVIFSGYFLNEFDKIIECRTKILPSHVLDKFWFIHSYYETHLFCGLAAIHMLIADRQSSRHRDDVVDDGGFNSAMLASLVDEAKEKLELWAATNPDVYGPRLLLLQGEIARMNGNPQEAVRYFAKCRTQSVGIENIYLALISAERTADAYLSMALHEPALESLQLAAKLSECWGAHWKTQLLLVRIREVQDEPDNGLKLGQLVNRMEARAGKRLSISL